MRTATLLAALLALAPAALASPGSGDVIEDKDLEPYVREVEKRAENIRKGQLKIEQLLEYYKTRAYTEEDDRAKAIYLFLYAQLLERIGQQKDGRKHYQMATKTWDTFPAAHIALAQSAWRVRDRRRYRQHIKRALRIDPRYVPAITEEGWAALRDMDLDLAEKRFMAAAEIDLNAGVCQGMAALFVLRYKNEHDEERKDYYAKRAISAARGWTSLDPKSGPAYFSVAQTYQELGRIADAIDFLEKTWKTAEVEDHDKRRCLLRLLIYYRAIGNAKLVKATLKRMLKYELPAEERAHYEAKLADVDKMGTDAFDVWYIETLIKVLQNDGMSDDDRVEALRKLLKAFDHGRMLTSPALLDMRWRILKTCFRILIDAPPAVSIEMMKFLRMLKDPHLIRIIVHFIYPYGDDQRTPAVRQEAVRALAGVGGIASLPALFYALGDLEGGIMRAVDQELSRICERRSPIGSGIEPLTAKEMQRCRAAWLAYARSDEGAELLAQAFAKLETVVERDPAHTRTLRSAPMVDHAVSFVLTDNDMKWPAWSAAYKFILEYWGKDYRAPGERAGPVQPHQRAEIVKALKADWSRSEAEEEAKVKAPDEVEKKKKPEEKPEEKPK